MSSFILQNIRLINRHEILDDQVVLVQNSRIQNVMPAERAGSCMPAGTAVVDGGGRYLAPGFIDLHIHGAMNHLADRGPDVLEKLSRALLPFGVTGFLPTLTPQKDPEKELDQLKAFG